MLCSFSFCCSKNSHRLTPRAVWLLQPFPTSPCSSALVYLPLVHFPLYKCPSLPSGPCRCFTGTEACWMRSPCPDSGLDVISWLSVALFQLGRFPTFRVPRHYWLSQSAAECSQIKRTCLFSSITLMHQCVSWQCWLRRCTRVWRIYQSALALTPFHHLFLKILFRCSSWNVCMQAPPPWQAYRCGTRSRGFCFSYTTAGC